jgi:hypothetical protein
MGTATLSSIMSGAVPRPPTEEDCDLTVASPVLPCIKMMPAANKAMNFVVNPALKRFMQLSILKEHF